MSRRGTSLAAGPGTGLGLSPPAAIPAPPLRDARLGVLGRLVVSLSGRRGPWALALLGLLLAAPALGLGLGGVGVDDVVQRARLVGVPVPGLGGTDNIYLELFNFCPDSEGARATLRDIGFLPWWAHPEARWAFLRPLSVATHVLDYRLWPDGIALQHAHSLLWFVAAILVTVLLLRRVCRSPAVAALAGLLFAVSDTHVLPAGWLCNRNALVAFVFGALAILAHVRWRRGGGAGALVAAVIALAAGLSGGEVALGACGYIAAYQLFLEGGSPARRLLALLPCGLLVIAWQLVYRGLGYGTAGLGFYQDPSVDPLGFLAAAGERLPVLLLGQWARISPDFLLYMPRPAQIVWLGVALVVAALLFLLFRRQLAERAEARFWAGGMLLCLVPTCAVVPMDRMLIFAGIGAFALLAMKVEALGWLGEARARRAPLAAGAEPRAPRRTRLAVGALLVVHVVVAPLAFPARIAAYMSVQRAFEQSDRALSDEPRLAHQSVVWVNGAEVVAPGTTAWHKVRGAPVPRASYVLSSYVVGSTISRPDARTLVIEPDEGFLARPVDRLFRAAQPAFRLGERYSTLDFTATVEEVTPDGRPQRVSFRFRAPLEDPSLRWLQVGAGYVPRPFRPPRVGDSLRLASAWL